MNSTTVTAKVTHVIPDSFLLDVVIDQAGYGIGYWAKSAVIDLEEQTYTITEYNDDPDVSTVLSFEQIANALVQLAYQSLRHLHIREELVALAQGQHYAGGSMDADDADSIIQLAAFGEVIYG